MCFHLAIKNSRVEMVKEFVSMSLNTKFQESFDINCKDGNKQTGIDLATDNNNYYVTQALCDPISITSKIHVNDIIGLVVGSETEYDKTNIEDCDNFQFFKSLLSLTNNIKGQDVIRDCIGAARVEYFKYLFEINNQLTNPFNVSMIWDLMTKTNKITVDIMRIMLETRKVGFEFSKINNNLFYFKSIHQLCQQMGDIYYTWLVSKRNDSLTLEEFFNIIHYVLLYLNQTLK